MATTLNGGILLYLPPIRAPSLKDEEIPYKIRLDLTHKAWKVIVNTN